MTEKPRETQAESHVVELKEKVNNSSLMKHLQMHDESLPRHRRGVTDSQARQARHDLSGAALALLDRPAVEVSRFDSPQVCEDFGKSMKPGGLGGHGHGRYRVHRPTLSFAVADLNPGLCQCFA